MTLTEILRQAIPYIEFTFTDSMKIERMIPASSDEWGVIKPASSEVIAENIPCRIDFQTENNDNPNKKATTNDPILWKPKVFTKNNVDIKADDKITITCATRGNSIYTGNASDVCHWETHIEFNIGIDKEA